MILVFQLHSCIRWFFYGSRTSSNACRHICVAIHHPCKAMSATIFKNDANVKLIFKKMDVFQIFKIELATNLFYERLGTVSPVTHLTGPSGVSTCNAWVCILKTTDITPIYVPNILYVHSGFLQHFEHCHTHEVW